MQHYNLFDIVKIKNLRIISKKTVGPWILH